MRLVGSVHNARKSLGNGLVERGGGRQARSKTPGCMCPSYTTLGDANGPLEPASLHAHVLTWGMPSARPVRSRRQPPLQCVPWATVPDEALVVPCSGFPTRRSSCRGQQAPDDNAQGRSSHARAALHAPGGRSGRAGASSPSRLADSRATRIPTAASTARAAATGGGNRVDVVEPVLRRRESLAWPAIQRKHQEALTTMPASTLEARYGGEGAH
jgi:hypothetical protein